MLAEHTAFLDLPTSTGAYQRLPISPPAPMVWDIKSVSFLANRDSLNAAVVLTHRLSLGIPTTFASLSEDESVWAVGGALPVTIPFGMGGDEGYMIAGPQLLRGYNGSATTACAFAVMIVYELRRVSRETWSLLRQNRSREI